MKFMGKEKLGPTLLSFAFFLFYGLTQSGTVGLEDSGGFLLTACRAGLSHPPGYPLWNLLGAVVSHSLPFLDCAVSIHWMQALFAAGSLFLFFRLCLDVSQQNSILSYLLTSALGLSFGFSFQARVAEVYALHLFLCLFCLTMVFEKKPLLLGLGVGASLANHWPLFVFWAISVLVAEPKRTFEGLNHFWNNKRLIAIGSVLGVLPLLHYFLVPFVSDFIFYHPISSMGEALDYFLRKDQVIKDTLPSWKLLDSFAFWQGFPLRVWEELGAVPSIFLIPFSLFSRFALGALVLPVLLPLLWRTEPNQFTLEMFGYWEIQSYILILFAVASSLPFLVRRFEITKLLEIRILFGVLSISIVWWSLFRIPDLLTLREDDFPKRYASIVLSSLPPNATLLTYADTESGSLGYLHYGAGLRPDIRLISQVSALFPDRIFDRRQKKSNETRQIPILNFFTSEMQKGNRVFTTRPLEAFGDEKSQFPLKIQKWGAFQEIHDPDLHHSLETPFPIFRLDEILILLEHVSEQKLKYTRFGGSWDRYREFLLRDLCYTLYLNKVSISEHPILYTSPECQFQEAQVLSAESKQYEEADNLFREALPKLVHLYRSEINEKYRDFVLNRMAWAKTLPEEQGKRLLDQTISVASPIALQYPFCKNKNLVLLEELSRNFPNHPSRTALVEARLHCQN